MADLVLQRRLGRLEAEVLHLFPIYGAVGYDDIGASWVYIERFPIGSNWNRSEVQILVDIPNGNPDYPSVPPKWFWTFKDLKTRNGKSLDHFFIDGSSNADPQYLKKGWGHFCIYVNNWKPTPANDLARGHSLVSYLEMISFVFHSQLGLLNR